VAVAAVGAPCSSLAATPANGLIAYGMAAQDDGTCDGCEEEPSRPPRRWVELVRPDGTHRRRFPCTSGRFETCRDGAPAFSPDGRRIALVSGANEVVVARLNGEVLKRIAVSSTLSVAWSPDGRRLAYSDSYVDPDHPKPYARHAIYITRLATPERRVMAVRDIDAFGFGWSSRGLLAWGKDLPRADIYVSDSRGKHRRLVVRTDSLAHLPRWSPDGRWLGYVCDVRWCAVRPDGTGKRRLSRRCTVEFEVDGMAWSPDGRQLACFGRGADLITVRLGTDERRIVKRVGTSGRFSPEDIAWQSAPQ
jgi:dipeptidyl aminopeptidase/acylaminoacyl peptidase